MMSTENRELSHCKVGLGQRKEQLVSHNDMLLYLGLLLKLLLQKKNNAQPPSLLGGCAVLWCYIFTWLIHYMDFSVFL